MSKTVKQVLDDMLSRREHSAYEVKIKLMQKGFIRESVDAIVSHYLELGLISDTRYAEERVYSLIRKGYGPHYVRQVLKQHNLQMPHIEFRWSEGLEIAKRKAGSRTGLKLRDYLFRRGFLYGKKYE